MDQNICVDYKWPFEVNITPKIDKIDLDFLLSFSVRCGKHLETDISFLLLFHESHFILSKFRFFLFTIVFEDLAFSFRLTNFMRTCSIAMNVIILWYRFCPEELSTPVRCVSLCYVLIIGRVLLHIHTKTIFHIFKNRSNKNVVAYNYRNHRALDEDRKQTEWFKQPDDCFA